ncbi:MAG: DUF6531 domain-containing protein, partial [Rhodocyclales bacterium]|nr:DUF6531 domain-containing protein [Rhodocyclales bacterium]
MTTAAPVAVIDATPQVAAQTLQMAGNNFDKWLRKISDGHVTLERLGAVAATIPVVGNLISIADVLMDIIEMSDKSSRNEEVDVFDWLFLGVDLVGVVPAAGNLFKAGARPTLKLCATTLRRSGKEWAQAEIEAALASKLASMVGAYYKGTPEEWVGFVEGKLDAALKQCAGHGAGILQDFASLLNSMGTGQLESYVKKRLPKTPVVRYDLEKTNAGGFWGTISASLQAVENAAKEAGQEAAAALTVAGARQLDQSLKGSKLAQQMRVLGAMINKWAAQLSAKLLDMAASHLKPLLAKLKKAFRKLPPIKTGAASNTKTNKVHNNESGKAPEVSKTQQPIKGDGPACSCAGSANSIGFALGEESLAHTDFSLPGVLPIVWQRRYRSNFAGHDAQGELAARWTLPYLACFVIKPEGLEYQDERGRSIDYPTLEEGKAHKDSVEGYTLMLLSENLLSQTFSQDRVHLYERQGDRFRLALMRDRAGNSIAMNFREGRLVQLVSSAGFVVGLSHDAQGRIEQVVLLDPETSSPLRTLAEYRYTPPQPSQALLEPLDAGDLLAAVDENGESWSYAYQHHLLTRYTDRTGRGITLEWDGSTHKARAVREYADDGSLDVRLAWDPRINLTYVTDAHGHVTEYYFDEGGYNYRIIYPDFKEEWFDFDSDKNLISHIYPDGSQERFSYDAQGNMCLHGRRDGSEVHFSYDAQDNLVEIIDPMGEVWKRAYDDKGQLVKETDPLGHLTQYAYNAQGLPVAITDAKGGTKKIAYRPDGLLQSYTDCSGSSTVWDYDPRGRTISITDALGNVTQYRYSAHGPLESIIAPDGASTALTHDAESRLLKLTDPLGRSTHYSYDKAGRLAQRTDANGHSLGYRYDRLGRLVSLINENHRAYQFEYDRVGRLLAETGFDGNTTRYQYDPAGRLAVQLEGETRTDYRYDRAGRLVERSTASGKETFGYDPAGRLYKASNANAHLHWRYDPAGNLVEEHHGYHLLGQRQTYRWLHEHDPLGNRIASIRPDGHRVDVLNYGSGHVHGLLFGQRDIFHLERDALHRETQRSLGNTLQQRLVYDPAGRLSTQQLEGATRWQRQYHYDAAGQLTQIADSHAGSLSYRYDPVGRLLEAATPRGQERFQFDPAGNLLDPNPPAQAPAN